MTNLTVRNIPDDVLEKIRTLSEVERRSLNNEILVILEKGLQLHEKTKPRQISKEMQLSILSDICGSWEDNRSTKKIIDDIYKSRSKGRKINL